VAEGISTLFSRRQGQADLIDLGKVVSQRLLHTTLLLRLLLQRIEMLQQLPGLALTRAGVVATLPEWYDALAATAATAATRQRRSLPSPWR
jgi:hypothetical protein